MIITTKGSGLVYDDAQLGSPIVLDAKELTRFMHRPIRRRLDFWVESNTILCLQCNKFAATYDELLPKAMAAIVLNHSPAKPSAKAFWQIYLNSFLILTERAVYTGHPRRHFTIGIRGDLNYAKQI